jgi:hypothetical protein
VKRLWNSAWLVLSSLAVAGAASALPVTLTLVPSSLSLTMGQTLSVDVVVGGLDNDGEIALESFDLDLSFDDSRLQFTSLAFGSSLGDPNDSGETFVDTNAGDLEGHPNDSGVVEMGVFSLLSGAQLLFLQSAPFVLATVEFEALAAPGSALLELVNLSASSLGGLGGASLSDTELETPAQLFVSVVPEPGVAVLLAAACALLAQRGRQGRG